MLSNETREEVKELIEEVLEEKRFDIIETLQVVQGISNRLRDTQKGYLELVAYDKSDRVDKSKVLYDKNTEKIDENAKFYDIILEELTEERKQEVETSDDFLYYGTDDVEAKYMVVKNEETNNEEKVIMITSKKLDLVFYIDPANGNWTVEDNY